MTKCRKDKPRPSSQAAQQAVRAFLAATAMARRIADPLGWEIVDDESGEVLYTGPAGC
jgi:hypothetical protein